MNQLPRISESEWQIMKILWDSYPKTAAVIIQQLSAYTSWSPKTIKSLINRLVKKKAIAFNKSGKEYDYFPIIRKEDCIREEQDSILQRLYNGEMKSMLKAFINEAKLSDDDINEISDFLKKKGNNYGK